MTPLFVRALFAFLAMPGIVAFVVPWLLVGGNGGARIVDTSGWVPFSLGVALLLWCVREFYSSGKGTLAPWSPPRYLVVSGPYRFSRNPMYVAVLLVITGWAVAYRSRAVATYVASMAVVFFLRVVLFEEPWLARTHGAAWADYKARVRRWV